jgi:hypothetical protein
MHVKKKDSLLLVCVFQFSIAALGQMPALSPLPQTGKLTPPADPTKFSFVITGDNRPADKSCPQPPTPGIILAQVKALSPAVSFVLWTGDTISGKDPKHVQTQYSEFLTIAATAGVPVFNAPGNHEMDDSNNDPSDAMKKLYEKYMAGTYGAFTYGNSRFIALDSEHEPKSAAAQEPNAADAKKTKSDAPGAITQKELDLLTSDLNADDNLAHVFIFMHHPVIPYDPQDGLDSASVQALQTIFAAHKNISFVVSGHEHMYYNSQGNHDSLTLPPGRTDPSQPPFYLVSGGAGAPLKKNTPGSFFHYIVFQVDGATVTPTLHIVEACDPCTKKDSSPQ